MENFEQIQTALSEIKNAAGILPDMAKRLDEMEIRMNRPQFASDSGESTIQREYRGAFENWIRNPRSQDARSQLEARAVTIGTTTAGGYAVPEMLGNSIHQQLRDISPVRVAANVIGVSSSDHKEIVDVGGTSSGWVGEGDTRSETDTPGLEEVAPTFGTVYAYPKASEESLLDIKYDVGAWLVSRVSEELAIREGEAFILGNGTKKPTGFLNGTPTDEDDLASPKRAFGTLQYFATGNATGFGSLATTSPEFYPADVLWTTVYGLRARYRVGAVWMMNSATAGVIRKFKDQDGRYLWTDSLTEGQPAMLCGYRVIIAEDMPDIGANAFPVAFGNFKRGYLIADSSDLRITVDDNVTTPGQVKFYARKRVGGKILDSHGIKLIKNAAS
jgi:HK97 family phage major capsid protein